MKSRQWKKLNPFWWILFIIVKIYRGITKPFPSRCRFHPTCSQYALDVLALHGFTVSLLKIVKRIGKCHPFHPGGIDYADQSEPKV
jgi:putative membrane protein insertion efficiency factor